jgi:ATP-dependent RNA helicase DeaD
MHGTMTDVNAPFAAAPAGRSPAGRRPDDGPMHRFQIDIGRRDRANEGAIVRLVCESAGITSSMIGRIVMEDSSSGFEVQAQVAEQVRDGLHGAQFDGRPVFLRDAVAGGASARRPPDRSPPRRGASRR